MPEQSARLASAREAAALRARGASCLRGELGDVFVPARRAPEGGVVRLGLRRVLGAADVTVEGLLPLGPLARGGC